MNDLSEIRRGLVDDQRSHGIPKGRAEREAESAVRRAADKTDKNQQRDEPRRKG